MSFHLPFWGLGSVHRIVGGIGSLFPSEAAAIGAARCGWEESDRVIGIAGGVLRHSHFYQPVALSLLSNTQKEGF